MRLARAAAVAVLLAGASWSAVHLQARAAQGQVFQAPQGVVENLRFEQAAGGVINLTYDLRSDDPGAIFSILLEVSQDGGASFTVKPTSVTGDVGPGVRPGTGKQIVWQASRDIENLQIDQFKFNIRASAGAARPVALGRLTVNSTPNAATVFIDGTARGATPLTIANLAAGQHEIRVAKDGFLENRRTVDVKAGASETVAVTLTATPAAASTTATQPSPGQPPPQAAGGGVNKFVWIGAAAGGAAAAGLALAGGGGSDGGGGNGGTAVREEVCGNGIDDNGNGQVDEGCPVRQEICGNGIDDNGNGQVDEGCSVQCTFALAPTTVPQFAAAGGSQTVQLTASPSDCTPSAWTASNSGATWVTINPSSGSGTATITLTAQANTATTSRSGSVTIAEQGANVSQGGATPISCTFRADFGADGDPRGSTRTTVPGDTVNARRTITVQASDSSCQWSVSGTPSWFNVVQGSSTQRGSGSVVLATSALNTTGRERSAGFRVAGIDFTVVQCAARCP